MARTKQELTELKTRLDNLSKELMELTEEELTVVLGGTGDMRTWMETIYGGANESYAD